MNRITLALEKKVAVGREYVQASLFDGSSNASAEEQLCSSAHFRLSSARLIECHVLELIAFVELSSAELR